MGPVLCGGSLLNKEGLIYMGKNVNLEISQSDACVLLSAMSGIIAESKRAGRLEDKTAAYESLRKYIAGAYTDVVLGEFMAEEV